MSEDILTEIMSRRGANKAISKACGISTSAVAQWTRVPRRHVDKVSEVTGIPKFRLRPDLHSEEQDTKELAA